MTVRRDPLVLLYYHKDPLRNFGDDLNPWLWPRILPGFFSGEVFHDPNTRSALSPQDELFIGIGTLLNAHVPSENRKTVLGAGVGYGNLPRVDHRWNIVCVRGPLTAKRLGLDPKKAAIDPAVLAVDYAEHLKENRRSPAFMPHCASARNADWEAICTDAGLRYIDPRWTVERVLTEIGKSSTLFTEALHGAIIAESFRIPWVPVKTSPAVLDFKWNDWCASIDVEYTPHRLPTIWSGASSALGKLRSTIKTRVAVLSLKQLVRNHKAILSQDGKFSVARARLLDKIDAYHPGVALRA